MGYRKSLVIVVALAACSCTTIKNASPITKKLIAGVSCALVAGELGRQQPSDEPGRNAIANAGLGYAGCYTAMDLYLKESPDKTLADVRRERDAFRKAMKNEGRYVIDHSKNDVVYGPTRKKAACDPSPKDEVRCSSKDGIFGDCSTNGFIYQSGNWAFQIAIFYSENGCFKGPYTEPTLKNFTKSLERRLK